jgi:ribosome recycling factor
VKPPDRAPTADVRGTPAAKEDAGMTRDKIRAHTEEGMKKSLQALQDEFKTLRGSRASQALFEKIRVDYYGQKTPINQVATISIPEARQVIIQPWDRSVLGEIEKAIQKSELSVNPNNDGKVIRINIPPLTEDRRKELVKLTKGMAENARVAIRNHRRDANEEIKKAQKASELSEDEAKKATDEIQKLTDRNIEEVNTLLESKEKEILEV